MTIWNGDRDTAILTNDAGVWDSSYTISNMFDSNPKTCWHSGKGMQHSLKIIGVHFYVSALSFYLKLFFSQQNNSTEVLLNMIFKETN